MFSNDAKTLDDLKMEKYLEFNFKGTALTVKQLQKGRGGGQ